MENKEWLQEREGRGEKEMKNKDDEGGGGGGGEPGDCDCWRCHRRRAAEREDRSWGKRPWPLMVI